MLTRIFRKIIFLFSVIAALPFWPWAMRSSLLRLLGVKISRGSMIGHSCEIAGRLDYLTIHNDVYINSHAYIEISAPVTIHEGTRIGPYFRLLTTLHPYEDSVIRRRWGGDTYLPTSIGRGCAIGIGAIILPGVSIEEGCIIAAGAVVTQSTSPNGMYAGVPAKRIKDLKT